MKIKVIVLFKSHDSHGTLYIKKVSNIVYVSFSSQTSLDLFATLSRLIAQVEIWTKRKHTFDGSILVFLSSLHLLFTCFDKLEKRLLILEMLSVRPSVIGSVANFKSS